jgi:hypothetical protein
MYGATPVELEAEAAEPLAVELPEEPAVLDLLLLPLPEPEPLEPEAAAPVAEAALEAALPAEVVTPAGMVARVGAAPPVVR